MSYKLTAKGQAYLKELEKHFGALNLDGRLELTVLLRVATGTGILSNLGGTTPDRLSSYFDAFDRMVDSRYIIEGE